MANLKDRFSRMLEHPKTQQMINKARDTARRPENRAKIERFSNKITDRLRRPSDQAQTGRPRHGEGGPNGYRSGGAH